MHVNNYMDNRGMGGQQNGVLSKHCPCNLHPCSATRAATAAMRQHHACAPQCVMNKGDKHITCIIACHCTRQHATKLNALGDLQKAGMQSQCNKDGGFGLAEPARGNGWGFHA